MLLFDDKIKYFCNRSTGLWTTPSTDEEKAKLYRAYNLDKLIIDLDDVCDQRLSFNDYPLQFMLRILDTIEPIKRFETLSPRVVLENISIKTSTQKQINISWTGLIEKTLGFDEWKAGMLRLKEWMKVDVYIQDENRRCRGLTINIL